MREEKLRKRMQQAERQYLGAHTSSSFENDPKHLVFTLARYKFVAKMYEGYESVLEVGCGDAFPATLVAQAVERLVCIDAEPYSLENAAENVWLRRNTTVLEHDLLDAPMPEQFRGVYALDVIEHLPAEFEERLLSNIVASNADDGTLIVGTPNATSSAYASKGSQIGHVNLKTYDSLKESVSRFYRHVFMFGMNDEVLHTGFGPMCHYLFALGVDPRR